MVRFLSFKDSLFGTPSAQNFVCALHPKRSRGAWTTNICLLRLLFVLVFEWPVYHYDSRR